MDSAVVPYRSLLAAAICAGISPSVFATSVENLPSSQSYTGLMFTPNAQVIDTGDFSFSFHQGVPYQNKIAKLDDWFFAAGVFPGLEAGGRIVTKSYSCNGYTDKNCGIRDLSASVKYQLPFIYDYTGFNLAIGAQDIGGEANNFDTKYIVADRSITQLNVRLSAGYGQSEQALGVMDGPFAGAEWQPLSFVQLVGEYDASEFNAMAKLFTPEGFLPFGAQMSFDYQLYTGHDSDQTVWGINAAVPLLGYNTNTLHQFTLEQKELMQSTLQHHLAQSQQSSLQSLASALKTEGFINIQLGHRDGKLIIALENRRYNQNPMDGVGVALGIIASQVGSDAFADFSHTAKIKPKAEDIELIMLTNGIAMFTVDANMPCYREFLTTGNTCDQLSFNSYSAQHQFATTTWLTQKENNGFGRSQLILSPTLIHRTATEYGFFDYSLGLSSNLYTPLWQGAALDVRHILPISESDDFKAGGIWANEAYDNEVDRIFLHQAFKLPQNIMTQFTGGYIYGNYWGGTNETNWFSPNGNHSLGFSISQYRSEDKNSYGDYTDKGTRLAHYLFSYPQWNWQFEVEGGEFWQGDRGVKATSSHWLGDTRLSASYLTSKADGASNYEDFLTLSISIPLTPWREMKPGYFQVRGIDQFTYSLQTRVGADGHNNLNTGLGGSSDLQHNLAREYQGQNRLSTAYFNANIQHLRNAYIRYLTDIQ
ncbi:TPA: YjbH domain-containing protein [Photobacterium damselae]